MSNFRTRFQELNSLRFNSTIKEDARLEEIMTPQIRNLESNQPRRNNPRSNINIEENKIYKNSADSKQTQKYNSFGSQKGQIFSYEQQRRIEMKRKLKEIEQRFEKLKMMSKSSPKMILVQQTPPKFNRTHNPSSDHRIQPSLISETKKKEDLKTLRIQLDQMENEQMCVKNQKSDQRISHKPLKTRTRSHLRENSSDVTKVSHETKKSNKPIMKKQKHSLNSYRDTSQFYYKNKNFNCTISKSKINSGTTEKTQEYPIIAGKPVLPALKSASHKKLLNNISRPTLSSSELQKHGIPSTYKHASMKLKTGRKCPRDNINA